MTEKVTLITHRMNSLCYINFTSISDKIQTSLGKNENMRDMVV